MPTVPRPDPMVSGRVNARFDGARYLGPLTPRDAAPTRHLAHSRRECIRKCNARSVESTREGVRVRGGVRAEARSPWDGEGAFVRGLTSAPQPNMRERTGSSGLDAVLVKR